MQVHILKLTCYVCGGAIEDTDDVEIDELHHPLADEPSMDIRHTGCNPDDVWLVDGVDDESDTWLVEDLDNTWTIQQ